MYVFAYRTRQLGMIYIGETDGFIDYVNFFPLTDRIEKETTLIKKCFQELTEYLEGQRQTFDLPIRQEGTPFQENVWKAVMQIPYGKTASYQDVAKMAGRPLAYRAAGNAINKNKICLIIPCHRVIKQDGSLGGYNGHEDRKLYLLEHEGGKI
ncbi:MAG: methylated-DNA--[protein]-cysteine S-methyltransferase [Erysipelotrichaceae bacterium]|nr:methylated-DNA--[protein]-cysteine S-methyltransferase [Erysipelotrichaceae bacterium]